MYPLLLSGGSQTHSRILLRPEGALLFGPFSIAFVVLALLYLSLLQYLRNAFLFIRCTEFILQRRLAGSVVDALGSVSEFIAGKVPSVNWHRSS